MQFNVLFETHHVLFRFPHARGVRMNAHGLTNPRRREKLLASRPQPREPEY